MVDLVQVEQAKGTRVIEKNNVRPVTEGVSRRFDSISAAVGEQVSAIQTGFRQIDQKKGGVDLNAEGQELQSLASQVDALTYETRDLLGLSSKKVLEMYRLPGDPPLTSRDVVSYTGRNEVLVKKLPEVFEPVSIPDKSNWEIKKEKQLRTLAKIGEVRESKRAAIVSKALDLNDLDIVKVAIEKISEVPEAERLALVRKGMKSWNDFSDTALQLLLYLPDEQRATVVWENLKISNSTIRSSIAGLIKEVPVTEQDALRQEVLSSVRERLKPSYSWNIREAAAALIKEVPESEQEVLRKEVPSLVLEGLNDSKDYGIPNKAIKLIKEASVSEQVSLIREALKHPEWSVRATAVEAFKDMPEAERTALVRETLEDPDYSVRKIAIEAIKDMPEAERAALVSKALQDTDPNGTTDQAIVLRKTAIQALGTVPEADRIKILKESVVALDAAILSHIISMQQLKDTYPDIFYSLQEFAAKTRLYKGVDEPFFQKPFEKGGSETFLLDRIPGEKDQSFRDRVIKRVITPQAYAAWKKAFEAFTRWKQQGFNYVPIEPIVKVGTSSSSHVDVYTRVLPGPAVKEWLAFGGYYSKEIKEKMERIKETLEQLHIKHGHLHEYNFVVVFEKDAEGKPDLFQPPRVYAIDFDMAVSTSSQYDRK